MTTTLLPRPKRRRGFLVLTPLVDVIFLLLIFFMLSSQIAPYSMLVLGTVEDAAPPEAAGAPLQAPAAAIAPLVVRVSHGEVGLGGRRIAISDIGTAARELTDRGIEAFLLIPSAEADVQDVVAVLEALKAAEAASVTVVNPGAAGGSRP